MMLALCAAETRRGAAGTLAGLALLALACLVAPRAFAINDGDGSQLIGTWYDAAGDHVVRFTAEGRVVMFLKRGQFGGLHSLEGTWTLAGDGMLTVTFSANGRTFSQAARLSYSGDEMILTDEKGEETRHTRITGALPAWTQW
jgi:hypothetical protein